MQSQQKKTAIPLLGAKTRKGVKNFNRGNEITKHVYKSKEGLIKAPPPYRTGYLWRASGKRADG